MRGTDKKRTKCDRGANNRTSKIIQQKDDVVVIKVNGHKFWSAIGKSWKFAPAQYGVYQLIREEDRDEQEWYRAIE
jgi:hypothetical protein